MIKWGIKYIKKDCMGMKYGQELEFQTTKGVKLEVEVNKGYITISRISSVYCEQEIILKIPAKDFLGLYELMEVSND